MKRTVDKEKFLNYLIKHPAAVKKLVNPSEDDLVECVTRAYPCVEFIPEAKQTKKIIITYLKKNINGFGTRAYIEKNKGLAARIPLNIVRELIKKEYNLLEYFPQAPKELWIEAAKAGRLYLDFEQIPESVVCEELLVAIVKDTDEGFIQQIPERFWTDALISAALDANGSYINSLPKFLITKKWVKCALGKFITELTVPKDVWDKELAELAAGKTLLQNIPKSLRSKEVCMKSDFTLDADEIPEPLWKDKDIQIAYVSNSNDIDANRVPAVTKVEFQLDTLKFLLNCLAETSDEISVRVKITHVIDNLVPFVKEWIPILKLWPEAIQFVPKPNQTSEHLMMTLQNLTEGDNIELIAVHFNLTKVTKEMVPMLLNVENRIVKDFIIRKLAPPPKQAGGTDTNEFIANVTPEEFRNINFQKGVQIG